MSELAAFTLPRAAPRRVLACGAFLKNTACLLDGDHVWLSPVHGDLDTPQASAALAASIDALLRLAGGRVDAVAHDLHPDFDSTRRAQALAAQLGVPAVGVQHHHAHIAAVQAECGGGAPAIGLALDGVGLGCDGTAWGGEVLWVQGARMRRLGHLGELMLPGGDAAAREPWRMAAAALHAIGRAHEIVPRLGALVGERRAATVQTLLARRLHCPVTTSAGRWFDAAAGLVAWDGRPQAEAEAAMALERLASAWLAGHPAPIWDAPGLDLRPLLAGLLEQGDPAQAAALFHAGLAQALAEAAIAAARAEGIGTVMLAGGCFHNRVLGELLMARLAAAGLALRRPERWGCGDAGLAPGQAWVAAHAEVFEGAVPCA